MLHKTEGIVLHITPYNDKFVIINMYTRDFGRASYMVAGTRGKKSRLSRSIMFPLSVVDLEVEHLATRDIQRIKEARPLFISARFNALPAKNALALFLSEILYRLLQEKEANHNLFDYLYRSIRYLEIVETGVANFHLVFLLQLSVYLGIRPDTQTYRPGRMFDLRNGVFVDTPPDHTDFLSSDDSAVFERLMRMTLENMSLYQFSRHERTDIIRHILAYYRIHVADFPEIKSLAVMQSIFD
ncbi:MAG: DNA repair protein RecO [Dysgonamonadaceae bacterium]|nr:DNA repair protein RecO [Dysgonamonadaceae bacterium]